MQNTAHEEVSVAPEKARPTPASSLGTTERDSAAIRRLLDEVRHEEPTNFSAHYNRMHNRHNR
jgi:hypothetical protein